MAGFSIDLEGRVKNFNLPKNQPLIPLFEAVVKSVLQKKLQELVNIPEAEE